MFDFKKIDLPETDRSGDRLSVDVDKSVSLPLNLDDIFTDCQKVPKSDFQSQFSMCRVHHGKVGFLY